MILCEYREILQWIRILNLALPSSVIHFVRSPQQTSKMIVTRHLLNQRGRWESSQATPSSGNCPPPQKWGGAGVVGKQGMWRARIQGRGTSSSCGEVPTLPVSSFSPPRGAFLYFRSGGTSSWFEQGLCTWQQRPYVAASSGHPWRAPLVKADWTTGAPIRCSLELRMGGAGGVPKSSSSQVQVYSLIMPWSPGGVSERQSFGVICTKMDSEIYCGV